MKPLTPSHCSPWLLRGLGLVAACAGASPAFAQDPGATAKMAPNVLLIVDTSGSMEYEAGLDSYPTCNPESTGSERSRWIDLVEVLTGTINDYSCEAIDRASSKFTGLYRLPAMEGGPASLNPPDYDYRNPYHRPLSGACALTPNVPAQSGLANAFDWAPPSVARWDDAASACPTFSQSPDGLIDSFTGNIRFGLMTFDTLPDDSRGHSGTSPLYADGIEGAWSYFGSTAAAGRPIGCIDPSEPMEVGARNGAAPAWEGKFIHFGDPNASTSDDVIRHTRIEQVLLSTRPYGATPIAGALTDAQTFLTLDQQPDPTPIGDPLHSEFYGPARDPYVINGCREQFVILLTDGEPNLDLRPYCEGAVDPNEECPYHRPEAIASELSSLTTLDPIKTFVVGFAATTAPVPDSTDCTTMVAEDWAPGGKCDTPATEELRVCCTLHEIAAEGGTGKAYFGNDKAAVRSALSSVFNAILAGGGSATQPVRSPGIGDAESSGARAFRILTSYEAGTTGVWRGTVERLRWICNEDGVPEEADKDAGVGDDFSFNVNSHPTARTFMTYVPAAVSGTIHSDRSVRPNIASADADVDSIGGNPGTGSVVSGTPSTFVTNVNAAALKPDLGSGPCAGLSTSDCKARLLTWFVGGDNGTSYHRCASPASGPLDANCSVIGDVMHSTPVIVDHPSAEIEDETYVAYRTLHAGRPMMVYTSSNDGVLHGFKLSPNASDDPQVDSSNSNEVFAFVPPAVLPQIDAQYPKNRQKLLDGVPIVQEVVATNNSTNAYYPFKLERSRANAQTGDGLTYRTILVQSFGGSQSGYFAVDITDPQATNATGPRLLWQLTTDADGNPLFGERTGTPLITTLMIDDAETAVAVLPGGHGSTSSGYCSRADTTHPQIETGYEPRWNVRCYQYDQDNNGEPDGVVTHIGARSLTIVRLDTGEVVMRFRRNAEDELPALPADKVLAATLDSPITGTPAAYPFGPGAVSDRIFVGDQDGALWRVDTSSDDPTEWAMTLFFDTFSKHPAVGTPAEAGAAGRPIVVAPTLSVNDFGQITVATATGDQDLSGGEGDEHFVWSLRETFNSSLTTPRYETAVNWYQPLSDGEHVLGPLQLNEGILYFSTFTPETDNPCSSGESTIFAVDYLMPANTADRGAGGLGRLSLFDSSIETARTDRATAAELGLPAGTVIFGLNLEYSPSCHDTSTPSSTFLGGNHTSVTRASSSALQLTFQTGSTNTSKRDLGFKTGFEAIGLNRPASGATIESWAAILE